MVDNRQLQHRPRTSMDMKNRLMSAVEDAGGNPNSFHDALTLAVGYLELSMGKEQDCPDCGQDTLYQKDEIRFECQNQDCPSHTPYTPWYRVIGLESKNDELPNPNKTTSTTQRQPAGTVGNDRW